MWDAGRVPHEIQPRLHDIVHQIAATGKNILLQGGNMALAVGDDYREVHIQNKQLELVQRTLSNGYAQNTKNGPAS